MIFIHHCNGLDPRMVYNIFTGNGNLIHQEAVGVRVIFLL